MKKLAITILFAVSFVFCGISQNAGIKTNFVHWATATPNLGVEFALNRKFTLEIGGGYNPFTFKDNAKIQHWIVQPEVRYWTCESFNGHFFGLHALVTEYNAGGKNLPTFGRLKTLNDYRYEGFGYGAGLSYGYQWMLSRRMNFEVNIGAGYVNLRYDKYPCVKCGTKIESGTENYFGITKAAVALIYFIK